MNDAKYPEPPDEGPGLLVSPAFWIGAGLCVLVWLAVFA